MNKVLFKICLISCFVFICAKAEAQEDQRINVSAHVGFGFDLQHNIRSRTSSSQITLRSNHEDIQVYIENPKFYHLSASFRIQPHLTLNAGFLQTTRKMSFYTFDTIQTPRNCVICTTENKIKQNVFYTGIGFHTANTNKVAVFFNQNVGLNWGKPFTEQVMTHNGNEVFELRNNAEGLGLTFISDIGMSYQIGNHFSLESRFTYYYEIHNGAGIIADWTSAPQAQRIGYLDLRFVSFYSSIGVQYTF